MVTISPQPVVVIPTGDRRPKTGEDKGFASVSSPWSSVRAVPTRWLYSYKIYCLDSLSLTRFMSRCHETLSRPGREICPMANWGVTAHPTHASSRLSLRGTLSSLNIQIFILNVNCNVIPPYLCYNKLTTFIKMVKGRGTYSVIGAG